MSMMDDIEKYAKIWDKAQGEGIFDDAPKPPTPGEPGDSADFFGNYLSGEYDMDKPLNEVDVTYWKKVSKMATPGKYIDPLKLVEEESTEQRVKDMTARAYNSPNPVYNYSVGKDQEPAVTQNWGVGGKEAEQLAELKAKLEQLEGKITATEVNGGSTKSIQGEIDSLRKKIDDLSDSLHDRWS